MDKKTSLNEGILGNLFGVEDSTDTSSDISEDDIKKVKSAIINKSLDVDDLDTEDLDNDDLDKILVKITNINEKVDAIIRRMCGCGNDAIARAIAKYTGMHIKEAEEIVADMQD